MKRLFGIIVSLATAGLVTAQPHESVVYGPHNLSSRGPGEIRAGSQSQVCFFCHSTHNAIAERPQWNRLMPTDAYTVYSSRALDALPGQPTGTSKMCLSCHDGTIALGSVMTEDVPISFAEGITTMPAGASNLEMDLSNDHPISFKFDSSLAGKDLHLRHPGSLPPQVQLDANSELQCMTCHDAHDNSLGNFLVMNNSSSQLCMACHQIDNTSIIGHSDCSDCHQPHSAPSGPYLLKRRTIKDTCLECHDGSHVDAPNVSADFNRAFVHDTNSPVDPPNPPRDHVSCSDCHEPHTMHKGNAAAPNIHPNFGDAAGMSSTGDSVERAKFEYEVCYQCHADGNSRQPWVSRQIVQNNVRLELDRSSISFHPVEGPGKNPDVPSLVPGLTESSVIGCSDCHGSEIVEAGGGAVHGSNFGPLLVARYETGDQFAESAQVYALCYSCHDRNSILNDESFAEHNRHIVREKASCSVCHDSHGISSTQGGPGNTNLINFDTSIVFPNRDGRLEWVDTDAMGFQGECFLTCHNSQHRPQDY